MSSVAITWPKIKRYFWLEPLPDAIAELDGLRGLAILLVLLRHGTRSFVTENNYHPLMVNLFGWDATTPLMNGWTGVDLFFILSGFLITYHILKRWGGLPETSVTGASCPEEGLKPLGRWRSVGRYLLKRALRIVPAYYAVLFIAVLGLLPFYQPGNGFSEEALWHRVGYHLLFMQDYWKSDIVSTFWSLGVEEKFYLLMPLVLLPLLGRRSLGLRLGVLGALIVLPFAARWWLYDAVGGDVGNYTQHFYLCRSPFHLTVDSLLWGAVCGVVYAHRHQLGWWNKPAVAQGVFWAGAGLVLYLLFGRILLLERHWFTVVLLPDCLAVGYGLLTLGLLMEVHRPVAERAAYSAVFRSGFLIFLARISYSLYLVHNMVLMASQRWWKGVYKQWVGQLPQSLEEMTVFVLLYLLVFGSVAVSLALAVHFVFEKPFLLIKEKV